MAAVAVVFSLEGLQELALAAAAMEVIEQQTQLLELLTQEEVVVVADGQILLTAMVVQAALALSS